ncbi:MAG TPA: type II toxin-antitoxin system RelE/ParE family toxin [Candidatus Sumerlaeota bacterium]|nr:type II toxin-antitoxin system RelE/ParE family toxin [Candidatus Sumerlaeota bacterium]
MEWKLRGFLTERGVNVVDEWYENLPPKAQARFVVIWQYLSVRPISEWIRPYSDTLESGLREIRMEVLNIQYRPIGCFGPHDREVFTILICAQERDTKLVPRNALSLAAARRAIILNDRRRVSDSRILE